MKKLIAMCGVAVLFTGCSGNFNINTNPDEANFDENYQGSPNIDLENAGKTGEPTLPETNPEEDKVEETTENTSSGEIITESEVSDDDTATGETVLETQTDTEISTGSGTTEN